MKGMTAERKVLTTEEYINKYFPIVKASTLSFKSDILQYEPDTKSQAILKNIIIAAITSNISDFRAQRMDPSINETGEIYYEAGTKPATAKSANWWKTNAEMFIPERGSRLGTINERAAFLGLLIEYLMYNKNYSIRAAWRAVCDQSKDLGNYLDSNDSMKTLENTGSRNIGQWYDLGNTYKIIANDPLEFLLFGGWSFTYGNKQPLSRINTYDFPNSGYANSVGWIVLPRV